MLIQNKIVLPVDLIFRLVKANRFYSI